MSQSPAHPHPPPPPNRQQTTAALLVAVRSGADDPAWRLFLERYEPLLLAVARRLGLDADDAQDLSQQTLLEFVRDLRAGAFDRERGRMRSWVLAIARNRVRDLLRARTRRRTTPMDPSTMAAEQCDPASLDDRLAAEWERELQQRILAEALDRLRNASAMAPETLRAFELVALHEVPPHAAARQCAMSVDQVYVARSRVAARLRDLAARIAEEWHEENPWAA